VPLGTSPRLRSSGNCHWQNPGGRFRVPGACFDPAQSPTFFRARPDLLPILAGRRPHDKWMAMWFAILTAVVRGLPARLRREDGQSLAEYGIVISVIAVIVIAAAVLLGSSISTLFSSSAPRV
jgi:pilus assembly protein Flp/PilA